ncbi:MAG: CAP domain-containing protein [Paracoccus sp. (in: a-proteobacteria)]|uniref:CAP domain-containing protein n=1 Tax=Paracoccus sp. TaxID=267 RepID=UPI0039E5A548
MTHPLPVSPVTLLLVLGGLAGCAAPESGAFSHHPKGYSDVQASAPGRPSCQAPSMAANRAAADATNAQRRARGLPPVAANAALGQAAARHACDMAARGLMSHVGTSTKGPAQRVKAVGYAPHMTAENIAAGPFGLGQVLNAWSNSQGHLDNILIPQIREVGIGRAIGADGRTVFWAAVYGAPR